VIAGAQRRWDEQAANFDEEPDHGLRDPAVRSAWARLLLPLLPPAPAVAADLGCGTGSLSVLLAEAGHNVLGIDVSPRMLEAARAKSSTAPVRFALGDAARPPVAPGSVDVVIARHVLWALDDPLQVLAAWVRLLALPGLLLLVEGRWSSGGGITAHEAEALVRRHRKDAEVRMLHDPALWGREVDDERYLLVSRC